MHPNTYLKEKFHNIVQNKYCWVCPWHDNIDLFCSGVDSHFLLLFLFVIFIIDIQQQREQETHDPLIGQLKEIVHNFQSSTDQLANNIPANIYPQMQMMMDKYGKVFWLILMNYKLSGMLKKLFLISV